jgi:hypothetical protein
MVVDTKDAILQDVKLPDNFSVEIIKGETEDTFKFSLPVELPYTEKMFGQYRSLHGSSSEPTVMTHLIIKKTLEEYVGDEELYPIVIARDMNIGREEQGKLIVDKQIHSHPLAQLVFDIHSLERFDVVKSDKGNSKPTIDGGSIKGFIFAETFKFYDERSYPKTGAAILYSLMYNKPLSFKDQLFRNHISCSYDYIHYNGWQSGLGRYPFFQIRNPTVVRMQEALKEEQTIADFFEKNKHTLKYAAEIYDDAKNMQEEHYNKISYAFDEFIDEIADSKKERKIKNMRSMLSIKKEFKPIIKDILTPIKIEIEDILKKGDEVLYKLSPEFPRGILAYALPLPGKER